MRNFLVRVGYMLTRLLLALHYKVEVRGADAARNFKSGVIVGLGHVAYVDPPIVKTQLARFGLYPRPVVYSKMYDSLKWIMSHIGGFRIESLQDGSSDWMAMKIRKTIAAIKAAVSGGETILVYPSGQTKSHLKESLGGKSSVFEIVQEHPEVPILAVNIYGLYGSLWSRYFTGGTRVPSLKHKLALIRKYPWQFLRRVPVVIEFKQLTLPACATARELNRHLEDVYHAQEDWVIAGREQCRVEGFDETNRSSLVDLADLNPAVLTKVTVYLGKTLSIDPSTITPEQSLEHDLGMDSMARVDVLLWIEEEFGKQVDENAQLVLVKDLVAAAQGYLDEVTGNADPSAPASWEETVRHAPQFPAGAPNIPEAFLAQANRIGWNSIALADERSGVLTYRQLLEKVVMLAGVVRTYPEESVGVMLPASVASCVVSLAVLFAGKRLVQLNWTNGRGSLDHAVRLSGVGTILSSDAFLDKASVPLSEETARLIVPLEGMRSQFGLRDLLRAKWLSRSGSRVLAHFDVSADPEHIAVVLFTSGSEAAPKGVPLSHYNIMTNVDGAIDAVGGEPKDVLLGFLPPFHSFGLTQVMMLCLIGGVKTVFEPDPKKYKRLALAVNKWQVSLVAGTPDFLSGILNAAEDPNHFSSLRACLSGAQKAPDTLKQRVRALDAAFLEGYGITETSPLVCVTRPGEDSPGVGRPIKETKVIVVDLVSFKPKPEGEEGLILVAGPGVFGGYLSDVPSPFVVHEGVQHYNTGDLGFVRDGSLTISGRLKRFRKYAGEMINLTMIEDALVSRYPSLEGGPVVAVEAGQEREGQPPVIVLYTTNPALTLDEANKVLKEKGFPPYCYVRKLAVLSEIPLLGTGKVNHRALPNPDTLQ